MRKLALLAAAAFAVTAVPASAAITIGSIVPGTNPYSGPTPTYDFDTSTPPTSGGGIVTLPNTSSHAQPYGASGFYYAVGPGDTQPGTIDLSSFGNIFNISFLWGSVDSYNILQFLAADGTTVLQQFTGNDIFNPANGNQTDPNTNPVVTFLLNGGDESAFTYLRLTTDPAQNAFEIDNIAVNGVPEASTWAMMLIGFGAIGYSMRRRKVAMPQLA